MANYSMSNQNNYNVIWEPLPGSQCLALSARCNEILYCGTRGGGKSELQLAYFRQFVGMGYGTHLRGICIDREYKSLDDLVAKSKRLFGKFNDGSKFMASLSAFKWIWPTGEELLFRAMDKPDDYWTVHGQEFPIILWNELCKFPTPELYTNMFSVNRSSYIGEKPMPLVTFATTNSKGPGKNWVKRRFIDGCEYGRIQREQMEVFDPQSQQNVTVERSKVAIFSSFKENKYLDALYVAGMMEAISDENTRKSWIEGSWDIDAGGAFDDLWTPAIHIIDQFCVPDGWRLDRSFDWGSTHPFAVCWWAQANGEAAENGFCPPPGSLIMFADWYGSPVDKWGENKGLKLGPTDVAQGIIEREIAMLESGWITKQPYPGPADNSIGNVITVEDDSIEKKMSKLGIRWTKSDKSPGSRKIGLQLFRDRLKASLRGEGPGIYFMRNCTATIKLLPNVPLDPKNPDDVDTTSEDHIWDAVKYRCLKGTDTYSTVISVDSWR